ncbi:MAG TPA: ATP-binding protein [Anaeromyxobacteraceae bacterium]|nr:ATP-binding protein [Anaeromyxobacteraceae bacterium]
MNVDEYGSAAFESFSLEHDRHAYDAAVAFVNAIRSGDRNRRLYLSSRRPGQRIAPGNGKTHLAVSIVRQLLLDGLEPGRDVRYVYAPKLLLEIRATFSDSSDESALDIVRRCTAPDVLVLDDLGTTRWTEFTIETMATIAEERAGRATVVTSNFRLAELREQALQDSEAGWAIDRVLSRLAKNAQLVELTGPDRRLRLQ